MRRLSKILSILILCILIEQFPIPIAFAYAEPDVSLKIGKKQRAAISKLIKKEIRMGKIPGAVVLIGNKEKILYRRAFGYRAVKPEKLPMKLNTIFDIASLTKVIATTTAIMQLSENKKINIEDPVAKYWPEFGENGKDQITVKELLTHYSGLRPDLSLKPDWSGYDTSLQMIISEKPVSLSGMRYVYSDINFIILGELVRRVSGKPLEVYCAENIFKPLGMKDTFFSPSSVQRKRIAPTQYKNGKMLWGEVHDPIAYRMGGVAGHAGLFSTADDLSIFAQMLLNCGTLKNVYILSSKTVKKMTSSQSPPDRMPLRGLGWEIGSISSSNDNGFLTHGSYGHLGYTGTSLWIDPFSKTYVIILTNRVHPDGKGDVKAIRTNIKKIISSSLEKIYFRTGAVSSKSVTGCSDTEQSTRKDKLKTGIDILKEKKFAPLSGMNVGLITNHSGRNSSGKRTIDLLFKAKNLKLKAIFSPEHGLFGNNEGNQNNSFREPETGLTVYSLYGKIDRPTKAMLKGLDALIFDIQDTGVRFYTYITTLAYAMEAAAKSGISFYVLDRPNPINASTVQGPTLDEDLTSFVNYFPMPVRYGMTVGELAKMFKDKKKIKVDLHIIKMHGYKRTDWYDDTGLTWINPSPNIRTLTQAVLYPGVAMVEGSNVSVGRGTDTPFEILGAPWINAKELSDYLNHRKIQGVRFMPVDFTPSNNRFKNKLCHGVRIILLDRQAFDPTALGIEILSALYRLFPKSFQIDKTLDIIGTRWILQAIKSGEDPNSIVQKWQEELEQFLKIRSKYLLY
jgi:uncharacterized protein YbbC (DUF1343 family)